MGSDIGEVSRFRIAFAIFTFVRECVDIEGLQVLEIVETAHCQLSIRKNEPKPPDGLDGRESSYQLIHSVIRITPRWVAEFPNNDFDVS